LNRYIATSRLPVSAEQAFAYHESPGCLRRLIPPWESVRIESSDDSLAVGSRVGLKTDLLGVPLRWVAEHTEYDPPHRFADVQVSGPFKKWHHTHRFAADGDRHCTLSDDVQYVLPAGGVGQRFGHSLAAAKIESMFAYRHRVTREDLELAARYDLPPQRIAVSGASGMVGSNFSAMATLLGHRCRPIVRHAAKTADEIGAWTGDAREAEKFNDVDVVVHLAGKPIAGPRWTPQIKEEIRRSRVEKTRELCETLAACDSKPSVLISASATGIYGDRGDEVLTEDSAPGEDFLAEVARDWEAACRPAVDAGIRVVHPRFGLILSPTDGALKKMLLPAKLMGGKLGSGRQWWSWIALDDVLGGLYHAMATTSCTGAMNFTAPEAIRNTDFASRLGKVLGRPALVPAPAFGLHLAFGEMADALLLASTNVRPDRLLQSGYRFRFPDLTEQLRYCLGKERLASAPADATALNG